MYTDIKKYRLLKRRYFFIDFVILRNYNITRTVI